MIDTGRGGVIAYLRIKSIPIHHITTQKRVFIHERFLHLLTKYRINMAEKTRGINRMVGIGS
tara:strand:- start:277 stop:462 length:186 start_codon:yes stop_codon:yes gene_type:complete